MRIFGIDPGTRVTGYGVVDVQQSRTLVGVDAGAWRIGGSEVALPCRLAALSQSFEEALARYQPQVVVLELAFVALNVRSALLLAHARGVIMAAASRQKIDVVEISATQAKKILTSYGHADKKSVARMLERLLRLDLSKLPPDATDALGLAYVHAHQSSGLIAAPVDFARVSARTKASRKQTWADVVAQKG